jgi:hypothetical protein
MNLLNVFSVMSKSFAFYLPARVSLAHKKKLCVVSFFDAQWVRIKLFLTPHEFNKNYSESDSYKIKTLILVSHRE